MNTLSRSSRLRDGFTLIELLTVITIIAILMAMLFPFIGGAKESARQRKADSDVRIIVQAVQQYNVEYGQFPQMNPTPSTTGAPEDDSAGDSGANMTITNDFLFNILRDIDKTPNDNHKQNPRRLALVETKVVANPTQPRDGFLDTAGGGGTGSGVQGAWYDPWGTQFNIVIDTTGDNKIDVSKFYTDFAGENSPRVTVGVFSLGKDKKLGKNNDKNYKSGGEFSDDRLSWTSH